MSGDGGCTVILPTYNEEANIGRMVDTLRAMYPDFRVLVMDDNSKDSTQSIVSHNNEEDYYSMDYNGDVYKSTYFMRECRFLRCTALELAYNLPDKAKRKMRMQDVKFFVRANNPFLISNFDLWDVELGENGFNYPIQKTFALGLNFSF